MDPRKTLVLADFDEVVRSVSKMIDRDSGVRDRSSTPAVLNADAEQQPAVIIGRTVVAGDAPRRMASLSKTHVWRRELTVTENATFDDPQPRTQVSVDESVIQRLSAELWAGQAPQGSSMTVTTVRQSIVDLQTTVLQARRSDPPATSVVSADEVRRADEAVAKIEQAAKTEVVAKSLAKWKSRVPRPFRLPQAKTIRIACLALCTASVGAMLISGRGSSWHEPAAPISKPSPAPSVASVAAASDGLTRPVEVESTWRPVRNLQPTASAATPARDAAPARPASKPNVSAPPAKPGPSNTASSTESPRAALDALIAGKSELALARYRALAKTNPAEPVYQAAASILEEANRRSPDAP